MIQRADDSPQTIQNRLLVYHQQTQPLIDFYAAQGILKRVDGTKDIDTVFEEICSILQKAFT